MKIKRIKRMIIEIEKQKTKKTNRAFFLVGEKKRKKNNYQQQFDYHTSSCATLEGRGYNDTSNNMVECQVRLLDGVACATQMVQM